MTDAKEQEIFKKISVTSGALIQKFKIQLYEYLETYTEGMPKAMIVTGGENNVIEVFRQLCDEGFSIRDRHLRKEYKRVIHPKRVSFENLKKAMMTWEAELAQYQLAAHYEMSDLDKIMCLEDVPGHLAAAPRLQRQPPHVRGVQGRHQRLSREPAALGFRGQAKG